VSGDKPVKIALIADPHVSLLDRIHCGMNLAVTVDVTEAIIATVERRRPDLVIWMGDLTHEGTEAVRQRFVQLHRRLTVPSLQLMGNHDVEQIHKAGFVDQTVPCIRRQWWQAAGWNLVLVDTVRERSPGDSSGMLSESDLRFLHDVAAEATGPLLVMGHHPVHDRFMDPDPFFQAVAPLAGTGVYIGAHSHKDRHDVHRSWHRLELAGCCCVPYGYHIVELSPDRMIITPIRVEVESAATAVDSQAAVRDTDGAEAVFPLCIDVTPAVVPVAQEPPLQASATER
jgi:DNA-binding transcriptional LysR family regulator